MRCAVYARVSVADPQGNGLTSIDVQVEACRAYIKSQRGLGWVVVEPTYKDEGVTGATLKRMPDASAFETRDLQWTDALRPDGPREVLARFYLPAVIKGSEKATSSQPVPLVVFSHGIGGSRDGYTYIGKHLAAHGIATLHVQHEGSDRSLWFGNPMQIVSRLQVAANDREAIARTQENLGCTGPDADP